MENWKIYDEVHSSIHSLWDVTRWIAERTTDGLRQSFRYKEEAEDFAETIGDRDVRQCWECGRWEDIDTMTEVNDHYICNRCRNEYYTTCPNCGALIGRYDGYTVYGNLYCDNCVSDLFHWCDECERYVADYDFDFDYDCCVNCRSEHLIGDYHSHDYVKVGTPKKGEFYKGCELEVDYSNNYEVTETLDNRINRYTEHIYFEHDGSLSNGFEIITQPHTITEFNNIDWTFIMEECKRNGFKSHDTSTCGLHLHYSREWFGSNFDTQSYNIGKVIAFYERNWDELLKFSRRTEGTYNRWAQRYYHIGDKRCTDIVKHNFESRYHAVNISNRHTIEFRLARGTLNIDSFMAWNDFHDCIVRNAKYATYKDIDNMSVWLKGLKQSTIDYMNSRNVQFG